MTPQNEILNMILPRALEINIENFFLISLLISSLAIAACQNLLVIVVLSGVFSLIMSVLYLLMSAPDVAMTEAAIGACISTAIIIKAIQYTKTETVEYEGLKLQNIINFFIVIMLGEIFIYGFIDLPEYGNINSPINSYLNKEYLVNTLSDIGIPSVVAAVLASYRGYDTLGETLVIVTAGIIIYFLLAKRELEVEDELIIKTPLWLTSYTRVILLPITIMLGFYIQVHGEISPGGGFQAGAILASVYIFYFLLLDNSQIVSFSTIKKLLNLSLFGFLIYLVTGIITILCGGYFLEYDMLTNSIDGQRIGIFIVEIGVGIAVFSVMLMIFLLFEQNIKATNKLMEIR